MYALQIVRPSPDDTSAKQGDTIANGAIIRLQHMRTRKWLHSHLHASPLSGNLEVSTFHMFPTAGHNLNSPNLSNVKFETDAFKSVKG